jgi:hypothetical protein
MCKEVNLLSPTKEMRFPTSGICNLSFEIFTLEVWMVWTDAGVYHPYGAPFPGIALLPNQRRSGEPNPGWDANHSRLFCLCLSVDRFSSLKYKTALSLNFEAGQVKDKSSVSNTLFLLYSSILY